MSHKKLRPFIVKVSVLGYFPYIYICFKYIIQLKYKMNNVLHTIITDFGKYYIICLFHSRIGLIDFIIYIKFII